MTTQTMDKPMTQADAGSAPDEEPHLTLAASTGWSALNLREVWVYRDLIWTLAGRDVKLRYKQTVLGVLWVVLQPLVQAGIFSFIFGVVAGLPAGNGKPVMVVTFVGTLSWNLFSNILSRVSGCLVGNSGLISKVYFPRLVLPLSVLPSVMLDFAVSLGMLAILMAAYGVVPGVEILLMPVFLWIMLLMALGAGLWAAALMVPYRDVGQILPVAVQMLTYASPVAYSAVVLVEKLTKWVGPQWAAAYYLNPLVGILEACKWSMTGTPMPPVWSMAYAGGMSVALLVGGAMVFKKMERRFADVI